ncbi:hypothetical protein M0R45_024957 [Rubus argutus]|uniref:DUF4283 domain-containing protein n=1 Tax=Rubus argutus TaxID=59490 RepID=A0AAW1WVR0_RUBAR
MGRERVLERGGGLERERISEWGNNRGKVSDRHITRVFRVESKIFTIQIDDQSYGGAILITEQTRVRKFHLSIGLGCAAWLIDQLQDCLNKQISFQKFTGGFNSYQFWLEQLNNKRGSFLRLSKSVGGLVKSIILPQGRFSEGWRLMAEHLAAIAYGVPKGNTRFEQVTENRLQIHHKEDGVKLNYKEALQKNSEMISFPKDKTLQVSSKENNSRWQCSVVCKRTSIKTSWTEISEEFSAILEKQVVLYPFQCNKAMLFCNSEEEAEWVARHKKIMVNLKDEVLLCRWEQKCNFHGKRKFVCFGGWIEIEGLPFNLWTNEIFKQIGDACGGYLETDYETENLLTLFAARIKVKSNEFGLIPEFVDVIGNFEAFYVRIHPSTLPSHYGNTKWKNASKEKKSVDAQTRISHSWEKLKAAVESSPTKIPAAATGKCSASDFKSIHMPRGLKDNKTEYQQKNPITFERLGSVELSPGWRKDLIKGDRSSIQKEKNVLENGRGTEVREKVDWNAQKFVDADMAGYTGTVAMGKINKELRPLGVLKNTKCVGADTVGRSKSVETGLAVRDQFLQKTGGLVMVG